MSLDVYLTKRQKCDHCGHETGEGETVFDANTTHNLSTMAEEAGIYQHCWCPEELGITKAADLVEPLTVAITLMKANPERFRKYNSKNGWGLYEHFVPWLQNYLEACKQNPEATIRVSR